MQSRVKRASSDLLRLLSPRGLAALKPSLCAAAAEAAHELPQALLPPGVGHTSLTAISKATGWSLNSRSLSSAAGAAEKRLQQPLVDTEEERGTTTPATPSATSVPQNPQEWQQGATEGSWETHHHSSSHQCPSVAGDHITTAEGAEDDGMIGRVVAAVNDAIRVVAGDSEFARGGLTLAVAGATAATARVVGGVLLEYCKRRLLVRAEIDSRDDAYRWMMYWLMQQPDFRRSSVMSVTTSLKSFGSSPLEDSFAQQPGKTGQIMMFPAPGDHVMWFRGVPVLVSRQRSPGNPQLASNARLMLETMRLVAPSFAREALVEMVEEARRSYMESQSRRTSVYSVDPDGYWVKAGSRPVRPLSSVVLPTGVAESILDDCRDFLTTEAWYAHRGIPYRRGYLLYGLPGTGKTSLVTALAGELGCNLYVVSLSSPNMTDEALGGLLTSSEEGSILLLEDVDAAFVDRDRVGGETQGKGGGGLSFSGLLNAIDGVAAQEGRMLFMTTNHLERLSDALIRPGRVDVRLEFTSATDEQKERLFVSFYSREDVPQWLGKDGEAVGISRQEAQEKLLGEQAKEFVRLLNDTPVPMAQLQGLLMKHKSDPESALQSCQSLRISSTANEKQD